MGSNHNGSGRESCQKTGNLDLPGSAGRHGPGAEKRQNIAQNMLYSKIWKIIENPPTHPPTHPRTARTHARGIPGGRGERGTGAGGGWGDLRSSALADSPGSHWGWWVFTAGAGGFLLLWAGGFLLLGARGFLLLGAGGFLLLGLVGFYWGGLVGFN